MTLQVSWHQGVEALDRLEDDYARLLSDCSGTTLFNEWSWIRAAAKFLVPAGREVRTVTVFERGILVACFPMTVGRESIAGLPVRTLRPLGYPLSDRIGLPVLQGRTDVRAALIDTLVDSKRSDADVAILSELPAHAGFRTPTGAESEWRAPYVKLCGRAPVLNVSDPRKLEASLSKTLRTRLSRSRKKVIATGQAGFERLTPLPSHVPDLLRTIATIEDVSWKGKAGVGIFSSSKRYDFFREVSLAFAASRRLEVLLYTINDRVVSYRYGFRVGRTFLDYNFAHPIELDDLSVGRLLLAEAIQTASASGIDTFDASRGSLQKPNILTDWTSETIEHDEIWLFARSLWGELLRLAVVKAKPFAKRVLKREEAA
ncbi:GNAT family N-acetyltransferase [Microvirga terrestris]|uniref:GNAT family N-acetyltransferase n=1 Tax=Microvirga terrestris TaxID=2791024 RepID=A0ABS0HWK3_9HYPH|nr:GNAT family N-acetyltransferase [Microvirga terrestris]MBF9197537.1 GNAT family N-acetyltransferase [Microvirga terrestris]